MISFLEKSIIFYSRLKLIFPYAILKKLKLLLFLSITCKKVHIHDMGFIAQIAELIFVIPFQTNLTFPVFLKISARIMDMRLFTCNR